MQNLKIKVNNEVEAEEAQELFEQIGYSFSMMDHAKYPSSMQVFDDGSGSLFKDKDHETCSHKEITLPELRDLVVLKRNDIGDATHKDSSDYKWYVASDEKHYRHQGGIWVHQPYIACLELSEMANQDQDEPFLTPECTLNDQYAEIEQVRQHHHYFKDVSNLDEIDVYMVLKLFNVTDPCLQHIAKKALCAGQRGHKDFERDLQDILDTAKRAIEINKNC